MKNYFKFNLTGNKIFPVWIAFMVLFIIPYLFVQFNMQHLKAVTPDPEGQMALLAEMAKWYGGMIFLYFIEYNILFFIAKLVIEGVELKEQTLKFVGKFSDMLLLLISGFLLSIITLGIYTPWFLAKMINFYAKNTFYNDEQFKFKGKGGNLFVLITLTVLIPMIVVFSLIGIATFALKMTNPEASISIVATTLLTTLAIFIIIVPFMYNYYKWIVNFNYRNFSIKWETEFWNSIGVILGQLALSIITAGIYIPLAYLKLFSYFSRKTVASSETSTKNFGYDIEPQNDFLYVWKELLLVIFTLGIYFPWAYCNITKWVLNKTYVEEIDTPSQSA